jgi:hypothetical protein
MHGAVPNNTNSTLLHMHGAVQHSIELPSLGETQLCHGLSCSFQLFTATSDTNYN